MLMDLLAAKRTDFGTAVMAYVTAVETETQEIEDALYAAMLLIEQ
jgi:hypothetical protein